MMGTIEEILAATLLPKMRELLRSELREALAEIQPAAQGDYLDVAGAAHIAGVHPETIRQWIREGQLPKHKAGREFRVMRAELDSFLKGGTATEGPLTPEAAAAAILNKKRGGP